ncbi:hypothetical protein BHF71_03550 [Vulcanibacillus modesticaldus]|uniref:Solute-binding protein family 5 domain-containing protein n=1 Tax=Vulcanibacillus modesticaldus TaxID=337097 RepID=A0A1D2YSY4_9BACI|nr:ABC transporter substrate-binding protein [Vulcanibacillus modesticaldus]OEF98103.1 hypothetical protein BHF71_03550 [Vulcanibacillus modesticaldus]
MKVKLKLLIVLVVLVLLVTACSGQQADTPDKELPPNKVVQEPSKGGKITIGIDLNNLIIDPLGYQSTRPSFYNIHSILYRGLLKYDQDLELIPDLASSFAIDEENKQIKIVLKDDLKWADGTPLTIEDVEFTFNWYSQRDYNGNWKTYTFHILGTKLFRTGEAADVSGIIIEPSERSITIQYDQIDSKDLQLLTAPILPKKQLLGKSIEQVIEEASTGKLMASGPYKVEIKENEWILTRNDYYEETVYLDQIEITNYNNDREFNFLLALPQDVGENLSSKKIHVLEGIGYQYLGMNLNSPKWKDIEMRKALALAIDYSKIIDDIYQGYADTPASVLHPKSWAFNSSIELKTNIEEAKAILNGKEINVELAYVDTPMNQMIAEKLSEQLNVVGITISLNPLDLERFIPELFSKGKYDLFLANWPYELDPSYENDKWLTKNDVLNGGFNVSHVNDTISDQLLIDGSKLWHYQERKEIYKKWQDYFMSQYYLIPLASPQSIILADPTLHLEIKNSLTPYIFINKWWIEK